MKKILFAFATLLAVSACVKDPNYLEIDPDYGKEPVVPATPAAEGAVVFNEFDCQNKKIELYNTTAAAIDMTGWILSKDGTEWTIPASRGKIAAKGFAVFTGKSDGLEDPGFGLSGSKGFVMILKDASGKEIDKVDNSAERPGGIVVVDDGKSWGRTQDGGSEWTLFDAPTIGSSNNGATPPAEVTKIVLNEVYGAGDDNKKFFELYNAGTTPVSLEGYTIKKDEELCWTGIAGEEIQVGGFFAIVGAKNTTERGFSSGFSAKKTVLVELFDAAGEKVDQFQRGEKGEGWGATIDPVSGSWSRVPDGTGAWKITETFTPGEANSTEGETDPLVQ